MANELDEMTGPVNQAGRDVHVIEKQIQVKVGWGSTLFQVILWVLGILPGVIFTIMKTRARSYLQQLQQQIQRAASTIDNYQVQRVAVLQNTAKLLDEAIDLDKDTFKDIAKYRAGVSDEARNELAGKIDNIGKSINVAFENYPDLKAHKEIADAMQQNSYLMQEVTAAREIYNDQVALWNTQIFAWPTKMIVAAKAGYTTRIPFIASAEIKDQADHGVFF